MKPAAKSASSRGAALRAMALGRAEIGCDSCGARLRPCKPAAEAVTQGLDDPRSGEELGCGSEELGPRISAFVSPMQRFRFMLPRNHAF